jgi:AraC family transcriptional regulator
MSSHYHDEACLVLVRSGSVAHTQGPRKTLLQPRSVLYLPPAERHADVFGIEGATCIVIKIDQNWIKDRLGSRGDAESPMIARDAQTYALGLVIDEEFKHPDELSTLIVEGSLLQLFGRWRRERLRRVQPALPWLARVKAMLKDGFQTPISLRDIARTAGVHPTHVVREFHRVYGVTTRAYVRKLRVNFVAERLVSAADMGRDTLADLAFEAGFSSHAHMTVVFKRITGVTPSQFRRMYRDGTSE